MAALGLQRVPRWFRLPFDAMTYVSVIVPELVIALATLVFFATTIGRDGILTNVTGITIGFGYHTIVGALVAVQYQPRAAARAGAAIGHGPDARRGELRPVRDALADVLADHVPAAPPRDRGRVPAVVHVRLRRLPDHDLCERPGHLDAAAVRVRPDQEGRYAGDERRRDADAVVSLTLLLGGQWLLGRYARRSGGAAGLGEGGVVQIVAEGGS